MRKILFATLFLFFLAILCATEVFAQKDTVLFKNNTVYVELLGNMGALSLNYERKIVEHDHGFFTTRIGFFGGKSKPSSSVDLGLVALINHVFCKGKNHFEIGGGVRLVESNYDYTNHIKTDKFQLDKYNSVPTANFSFRHQKPDGRFMFRLGWTPLIYPPDIATFQYLFFCGISVGYVF
ncbi:MAG: hypothetical protein HY841_14745 [Bacteroidetes bacterium]|nr:hypothetical protein [Bacteroidota bacterium]